MANSANYNKQKTHVTNTDEVIPFQKKLRILSLSKNL